VFVRSVVYDLLCYVGPTPMAEKTLQRLLVANANDHRSIAPQTGLTTMGKYKCDEAFSFDKRVDREIGGFSARYGASVGTLDSRKNVSYFS
jgi:hypothetical protein